MWSSSHIYTYKRNTWRIGWEKRQAGSPRGRGEIYLLFSFVHNVFLY